MTNLIHKKTFGDDSEEVLICFGIIVVAVLSVKVRATIQLRGLAIVVYGNTLCQISKVLYQIYNGTNCFLGGRHKKRVDSFFF